MPTINKRTVPVDHILAYTDELFYLYTVLIDCTGLDTPPIIGLSKKKLLVLFRFSNLLIDITRPANR